VTVPRVGVSSPAAIRSKVDLPQPDGPRMVMKSFSATSRSTGSKATVSPAPWAAANFLSTARMDRKLM
jgi:hypothetical protein